MKLCTTYHLCIRSVLSNPHCFHDVPSIGYLNESVQKLVLTVYFPLYQWFYWGDCSQNDGESRLSFFGGGGDGGGGGGGLRIVALLVGNAAKKMMPGLSLWVYPFRSGKFLKLFTITSDFSLIFQ